MARYEYTEDGSSKFWQITVEGSSLSTRYGNVGQKGRTTTKTFASEDEARAAAEKLVQEKLAKGYVEVAAEATAEAPEKPKRAAKPKKEPQGAPFPSFPGIEDKALRALAQKLDKTFDPNGYKHNNAILKVNGNDWGTRHALLWHLAAHRLVKAEANIGILYMLAEQPTIAEPAVVADLFSRLPANFKPLYRNYNLSELLDRYPLLLDNLLFQNYLRAPELFTAREAEMAPNIRRALAFVRRRAGEEIPAEVSDAILEDLAHHQGSSYGLALNNDVPMVRDGQVAPHRLKDLAAVRELALLFGTRERWNAALLAVAKTSDWSASRAVEDALLAASPAEMAELLGSRFSFSTNEELTNILDIVTNKRNDPPRALLEAARGLRMGEGRSHAKQIRDMLAVIAARRFGEVGEPVPEELDALLDFEFLSGVYHVSIEPYVAGLRAMPRERVLSLMRKKLAEPYGYANSVGGLIAHFDEALLREYLEKDAQNGYFDAKLLGGLPTAALPALEESIEKLPPDRRRARYRGILELLARAAGEGEPIDAKWDAWVRFDDEGGEEIKYWDSSYSDLRGRVLRGIPEERRRTLLMARMREGKYPDRPLRLLHLFNDAAAIDEAMRIVVERREQVARDGLTEGLRQLGEAGVDALCRHIGLSGGDATFLGTLKNILSHNDYKRVEAALGGKKETLRAAMIRLAAAGPEPRERVYVLHVGHEDFPAAAGSLSRSGGAAPGLGAEQIPKDKDGEPFAHLFTLDLREMPELGARYAGARALALFCPEPDTGEHNDDATLVPIAEADCERAPNLGQGERPIAVTALDVPTAAFSRSEDPGLKALRKHIFNAAGHVLGEPLWIQDDEWGAGPFVVQVNESLADINLGDSGSLYVFANDAVFQCY